MSGFPNSPHLLKAGLVLVDAKSGSVQRVITLQYNPDTLTRNLQAQTPSPESGDRAAALRLKGPAIETWKLEAEIDATDQLEFPEQHAAAVAHGIQPQLAALELLLYPTSAHLNANRRLADSGTLEIAPAQSPLALFVWGRSRVLPVRVTEFSVTEEAFDPQLNPMRARVSLGLRVLSVDDLGFEHRGGNLFMNYLQGKEQLVGRAEPGNLAAMGGPGLT